MNPTPNPKSNKNPWRVQVPGRYFADGKRATKYFTSKEQAEAYCRNVKKLGLAAVEPEKPVSSPEADRYAALINHALETLGGDPARLFEAISHFQKTRMNVTTATVRQAVEQFQEARRKTVRNRTWNADRTRLIKLVEKFENCPLAEVTETDLRKFFDNLKVNPRSIYKTVAVFFGWAKQYNFVGLNPMAEIKPVGEFGENTDIYPVETFERMLRIAAGLEPVKPSEEPTREYIDLLPWFVLSGFCGLRSCEVIRLTTDSDSIRWNDLYFDREFIMVRDEIAKATRRKSNLRYIETAHYLTAARSWLELAAHNGEFMVRFTERKIQNLKTAFEQATGIRFVENGFRNSFASYALTFSGLEGVGKLAIEMGNSEAICKRFYVKTLEPRSGKAWFGLRPFGADNVVSIAAAA